MTTLFGTLIVALLIAVLYLFFTIYLTKYMISGGKSPTEIIEKHALNPKKLSRFLKKYPEADIKTGRNFMLAFGFIFAFASSIYAFNILGEKQVYVLPGEETPETSIFKILPPISTEKKIVEKKKVPPPPPQKKETSTVKIVEDTKEETKKTVTEVTLEDLNKDFKEIDNKEIEIPTEKPFWEVVEEMPVFKGCEGLSGKAADDCTMDKILAYISKIKYPIIALEEDIEAKVHVYFVIDETGKITQVEVARANEKILDKAAVSHIKNMPGFASAGMQRGKKVKVRYNVPINFKIR